MVKNKQMVEFNLQGLGSGQKNQQIENPLNRAVSDSLQSALGSSSKAKGKELKKEVYELVRDAGNGDQNAIRKLEERIGKYPDLRELLQTLSSEGDKNAQAALKNLSGVGGTSSSTGNNLSIDTGLGSALDLTI